MKKKVLVIVLLLFAFILAACGGGDGVNPEAIATQASGVVGEVRDAVENKGGAAVVDPTEEPTATPEPTPTPEPTEVPVSTFQGEIVRAGDSETRTFVANAGDKVHIVVSPIGDSFDVVFDVIDSSGKSLFDEPVDDSYGEESRTVTIPYGDSYTIKIWGLAGMPGKYNLSLSLLPAEE